MGLDFTWAKRNEEETAHWAYSGFNRFRERLAAEIGVNLREMAGFEEWRMTIFTPKEGESGKSWDTVKDPLKHFLNHSDCDGQLSPKRCGVIAERIDELTKDWDEDYDKEQAKILVRNMRICFRENVPLKFT